MKLREPGPYEVNDYVEGLENTVEKLRTALADLVESIDLYDDYSRSPPTDGARGKARAVLEETK